MVRSYEALVAESKEALGFSCKLALDLAKILDNSIFQFTEKNGQTEGSDFAEQRESVFTDFCAVLVSCGLPVPPLEEGFWKVNLPKFNDKASTPAKQQKAVEFADAIEKKVGGLSGDSVHKVRSLVDTLTIFPELDGFSGVNRKAIVATINQLLVRELALEPIRPNYAEIAVRRPRVEQGPSREFTIVAVDDEKCMLISSARILAGIPNVSVVFQYYDSDGWKVLTGAAMDAELEKVAGKIIDSEPDLILMDQGLKVIQGSDLVITLKRLGCMATFVANTGGSGEELREAGCLGNFEKGRKPRVVLDLLARF